MVNYIKVDTDWDNMAGYTGWIIDPGLNYSSNRNFRPNLLFSSSTQISRQKQLFIDCAPIEANPSGFAS